MLECWQRPARGGLVEMQNLKGHLRPSESKIINNARMKTCGWTSFLLWLITGADWLPAAMFRVRSSVSHCPHVEVVLSKKMSFVRFRPSLKSQTWVT